MVTLYIGQRYIDWSSKVLHVAKYGCSQTCGTVNEIRTHTNLEVLWYLFILPKTLNLWRWPHAFWHHLFILVCLRIPTILFQTSNLPTMKTTAGFSGDLVDFLEPLCSLDVVLVARVWDFVVDTCATNAVDSAAIVDVYKHFCIVYTLSDRPFFVVLLLSSDSKMPLNSW
jgi:hypothetical protein